MKHKFLDNNKSLFNLAGEHRECSCGVWRMYDEYIGEKIPCWNSGERGQTMGEAQANLHQKIRNLGYEITRAWRR